MPPRDVSPSSSPDQQHQPLGGKVCVACAGELDRLRCEQQRLSRELESSQNAIAELNAQLESALGRSNALVLESEISKVVAEEIFNTSQDAIWMLDGNFNIVRLNKQMATWVGKPRQELIGRKCFQVLSLPCCGTPACSLTQLLSDGEVGQVKADVEVEFPAQGKASCILSATACLDPCGEAFGVVEAFTDITARKSAEDALRRANEELAAVSRTDGLTGVANRRHFDEVLQIEWRRLFREKQKLAVLIADVDFFKRYNDSYGHPQGDVCLTRVAGALRSQLKRPADLAARYGGEEFAAILPNTHAEGALHVAECVRREIESLALPHNASGAAACVTISVGVACLVPQPGLSPTDLIERADSALYEAKEQGRNRSVLCSRDPNPT